MQDNMHASGSPEGSVNSNGKNGKDWKAQILALRSGQRVTVEYPKKLHSHFASAIGGLRRRRGVYYAYRPLGDRRFEVYIRDDPPDTGVTLTREDVAAMFAAKAEMPKGTNLTPARLPRRTNGREPSSSPDSRTVPEGAVRMSLNRAHNLPIRMR